jgi:nucleotide-binding universal stress UspA family protein
MARYLVVANQTLGGDELVRKLEELTADEPSMLVLLVPVTDTEGSHQWDYPPIDRVIPDAHQIAAALAAGRLEHELARLHRAGIEATGEVVEADPVSRAQAVLAEEAFDAAVVCTLPRRMSRWLLMDLPHRLARLSPVPVIHVEGTAGPSL